jgi:predicted transcriptional regulator
MKKKVMVLVLAGILTVSGMSLAYAAGNNSIDSNRFNGQMMNVQNNDNYRGSMMSSKWAGNQSDDNINKMIELMKENGFTDEANAMENGDFNAMNKLMTNLSDDDYNKMIDVMKNNGYESMANIMQSVGKEKMVKFHQSMMGN